MKRRYHTEKSTSTAISAHQQIVNGAEAVLLCLLEEGIDTIFGYPGGAIMPVYDSLFHFNAIDTPGRIDNRFVFANPFSLPVEAGF